MQTVAVIFGGRSTEHDISVVTAIASIIKPLELIGKYQVEAVYISKDGVWFWDDRLKDINLFSSGKIDDFVSKTAPASVLFNGSFTLTKPGGIAGTKRTKVDIAFPAMHGTYGEDGTLMGLLEMANVPFVGCNLAASAVAMDKVLAKQVAQSAGIPVTPYKNVTRHAFQTSPEDTVKSIETDLKYPLFIKPAHLGSSIGISRAADKSSLMNGLEVAAHYDDKIIVEEEVNNLIEVTLPIMGNEEPIPASLEKPLTSPEDFFDFETKYMQGGKSGGKKGGAASKGAQGYSELPAKLEDSLYKKAEKVGLDVYAALGCSGTARVDMLIDSETKDVYFNEVNPLPGGLYLHNWRASGKSSVEVVEALIKYAIDRYQKQQAIATTFDTNYLKQF